MSRWIKSNSLNKEAEEKTRMPLSADDVISYIDQSEGEFKANFTGAWDKIQGATPKKVTVNVGRGFEDAVAVSTPKGGYMLYVGPYFLENEPAENTQFLFYCEEGLFIKGL